MGRDVTKDVGDLLTFSVERQGQGRLQPLMVDDALDVVERPRLEEKRAGHYRGAVALVVGGGDGRAERPVVPADVPRDLGRWARLRRAVCLGDSGRRGHVVHLRFG